MPLALGHSHSPHNAARGQMTPGGSTLVRRGANMPRALPSSSSAAPKDMGGQGQQGGGRAGWQQGGHGVAQSRGDGSGPWGGSER